jgi:nicotinate-nucleotide adenylyltransferase
MEGKRRIGFLGGTFDPVHAGHLAAATAAFDILNLEALWFIPSASPPHKASHANGHPLTPLAHRVAMLQLALKDHPGFVVSLIEAERRQPSYTIDTLRILRRRFGPGAEFFFLVGMDAFAEIDTWKDFELYPTLTHLAVVSRPPLSIAEVQALIARHYPGFTPEANGSRWRAAGMPGEIRILTMRPVEVSSTKIRRRRREGVGIDGLVPPTVARYIEHHGFYRS